MSYRKDLFFCIACLLFTYGATHIFVNDNNNNNKKCNENYLKYAQAIIANKSGFQYYTWHSFEPAVTTVTFLQIRSGNVREICKNYLSDRVMEVILLRINLEYIEPGYFESEALEQVFIEGNNLRKIKRGVFSNTKIRSLVLSGNNIEYIEPNAFDRMEKLEAIALDDNKIQIWDSTWFYRTRVLYEVSITHNSLTELPEDAVKSISQSIENDIFKIYGSLLFDNNKIKYIHPNAFGNLRYFHVISLSNNRILQFPDTVFGGFRHLFALYINTNEFICFDDKTISSLHGVKRLFLGDNKINTECMDRIKNFFERKGDTVFF